MFTLLEHYRRRLRFSNPIKRAVQQELKRRTVKVRFFPNEQALLRLVSAVLVEIDETWACANKAYIKLECREMRRDPAQFNLHTSGCSIK